MEDKNKSVTRKHYYNEVSCREKIESNNPPPTINANGRKGCKTSIVSALKQVRTSSIVSNTEGRISSDGLNLHDEIRTYSQKTRILIVQVMR